jgi:hypothetical protein
MAATLTAACSTAPLALGVDPHAASFRLECKSQDVAPTRQLSITMEKSEDGSVVVAEMDGKPIPDYATHTYVNSYMWTNGVRTYSVDRFSGVLKVKPEGASYDCRRPGVQIF